MLMVMMIYQLPCWMDTEESGKEANKIHFIYQIYNHRIKTKGCERITIISKVSYTQKSAQYISIE